MVQVGDDFEMIYIIGGSCTTATRVSGSASRKS